MAYRSSVHESTGFSPYRLMFGEECTLPMDIGLPKEQSHTPDSITSPYAIWVRDALEEAYEQVCLHSGQAVQRQKRLYDRRAVKRLFAVGDWVMRFYTPAKKCKLDSAWIGPYLAVSIIGWALGIQKDPESPIVIVHCQDIKKVPPPRGAVSWLATKKLSIAPSVMMLGASTMTKFTFVNGGASGRRYNDCRCRIESLCQFFITSGCYVCTSDYCPIPSIKTGS